MVGKTALVRDHALACELVLGHIAHVQCEPRRCGIRGDVEPRVTVLVQRSHLLASTRLEGATVCLLPLGPFRFGEGLPVRLPEQFSFRLPGELECSRVGEREYPVAVEEHDAVADGVERNRQALLQLHELGLLRLDLGHVPDGAESARDRPRVVTFWSAEDARDDLRAGDRHDVQLQIEAPAFL